MSKERKTHTDDKEDDRKIMGVRLREAREYLGFSQDQVAIYLGVPRTALSLLENGQRKVDALELKKLAELYKRPVGFFTGEETEQLFNTDVKHLARQVAELSLEDRNELARFAEFLRAKSRGRENHRAKT